MHTMSEDKFPALELAWSDYDYAWLNTLTRDKGHTKRQDGLVYFTVFLPTELVERVDTEAQSIGTTRDVFLVHIVATRVIERSQAELARTRNARRCRELHETIYEARKHLKPLGGTSKCS